MKCPIFLALWLGVAPNSNPLKETNRVENHTNFAKAEIKHTKKFENLEVEENSGKVAVGYAICDQCKKHLPEANMELHLVHCARLMKQAQELRRVSV